MGDYRSFLSTKRKSIKPCGIDVPIESMNEKLFPWQKAIVRWALKRGKAALFEDCGLGKTAQQLEWARCIAEHEGGRVLVLTPLAVAAQTLREADKFGIRAEQSRDGKHSEAIVVTNYQRLHYFNPHDFVGIVLDESSILKAFEGQTRKELTEFAAGIKYRLACTATPSPNDLIELTNHAEFLDIMRGKEIIALFFRQDGNTTHAWRLKGHAVEPFYEWLAEWSLAMRKPSDLGYPDDGFNLPRLKIENVQVEGHVMEGELFQLEAQSLLERRQARKNSLGDRVSAAAEIANGTKDQILVWCDLNSESEMLARAIDGAVEVKGSDDADYKERMLLAFSRGEVRCLVSKPTIAGHGMNWQQCNRMIFTGLSDSYEQYYQAVRRCWRFGQKREVTVYVVTANTEGAVVKNIRRKEEMASGMFDELVKRMRIYEEVSMAEKQEEVYTEDVARGQAWTYYLGDSCERIKEVESDSVGLSVFSPPFPGMYAYTNSERDIGNSDSVDEMMKHFAYIMPELLRITMPGRNCCIHLMQLTAMKSRDGYIGVKDYRGRVIASMGEAGWRYAGEVCIDKNPQIQATRNKERGLLFKTLATDSSMMRMALADYVLLFRKDGDNPIPIRAGHSDRYHNKTGWITEEEWIEWASPVWYRQMKKEDGRREVAGYPGKHQVTDGIRETDVLSVLDGREDADERHLCPLQLGVIERCIKLWSAPGDTVFSPFGGIGSEGYQAIRFGRKFIGVELKRSYWEVGIRNLKKAEGEVMQTDLFKAGGVRVGGENGR
jgi:DNA modification methylase